MKLFKKIAIIGAGSYGTALAQCFSEKAESIMLISRSNSTSSSINKLHINVAHLPGIGLNHKIFCTSDILEVRNADLVFAAVPVSAVVNVCGQIGNYNQNIPIILCSKGFDVGAGRLLSESIEKIVKNDLSVFSGPSFASDIAQGLPAGVNIASRNIDIANRISESLSTSTFKIRTIDDFIGLQVAGAMKNILAVGCGVLSGLKLGRSAISQFIVNGLHEMMTLAEAMGGKRSTFLEYGGLGDVILTCTSTQSRNTSFGEHLATGKTLADWKGNLVEGAIAAKAIPIFAKRYGLKMPIFTAIHDAIYECKCLLDILTGVM